MKKILFSLLMGLGFITSAQTIALQTVVTGLSNAVEITHCGDNRLFVVQQGGLIRIIQNNALLTPPFLNISSLTTSSGEQGLLGLAFHPNYATNGQFFVNYTNLSGDTVIARYTVSSTDPNVANPTGTILMTIDQPYNNHNGGTLKFGPDGYLYIGMGDGGSGGDPQNYAQNMTVNASNPSRVYLGKMLRLDVNTMAGSLNYGFPPTNPYVNQSGKQEIWAVGLRNPWKFTFNRLTGDLWIADVGQDVMEEINRVQAPLPNTGLNFGWKCFEGTSVFATCANTSGMIAPFAEYSHAATGGCSITGGYVYTGTLYPNMLNKYYFADLCQNRMGILNIASGAITYTPYFNGNNFFTSFGEDVNGELYITGGSSLFRITDTSLGSQTFAALGLSLAPNPSNGIVVLNNPKQYAIQALSLLDVSGKIIQTIQPEQSTLQTIDMNSLTPGLYFLQLEKDGLRYTEKIIRE
ncbi:PQQ-dependent sugar dehydrogenase [Flavobacterium sp.]|uniref:PQQ-dependent sugar dehydrogenase n=1 Tax=Flavobacterium sp. TaxID=239 RepID=UPI0033416186